MVATTKCTDLLGCRYITPLDNLQLVNVKTLWHVFLILGLLMMILTKWYLLADTSHNLLAQHLRRYRLNLDVSFYGAHATTDVHADSVGDDHAVSSEHRSYGHALASVKVRHQRDMMINERKRADIGHFLPGMCVARPCPHLDGRVVNHEFLHICL